MINAHPYYYHYYYYYYYHHQSCGVHKDTCNFFFYIFLNRDPFRVLSFHLSGLNILHKTRLLQDKDSSRRDRWLTPSVGKHEHVFLLPVCLCALHQFRLFFHVHTADISTPINYTPQNCLAKNERRKREKKASLL